MLRAHASRTHRTAAAQQPNRSTKNNPASTRQIQTIVRVLRGVIPLMHNARSASSAHMPSNMSVLNENRFTDD